MGTPVTSRTCSTDDEGTIEKNQEVCLQLDGAARRCEVSTVLGVLVVLGAWGQSGQIKKAASRREN